jgi:probable F420-dependent oxidoreductase
VKFVLSAAFNDPRELGALATTADACGYEALSLSDHVVHPETLDTPYPYTADGARRWPAFTPWPDPWVTIGHLAAITRRLRFNTNVFVLPLRNPFLVAKAVATAALLSGDRVTLTVGVGWSRLEFELMGQDFATRGRRCDEAIAVLRKLWSGGWAEHRGEFYSFPRLEMTPVPAQRIPIWVGGISDAALRRAARNDGWLSDLQTSAEIIGCIERIRAHRAALGRSAEPFAVMASASDVHDPGGYRRLEDAGVTHALTIPWIPYHGLTPDLEKKRDGIARFAEDFVARLL